MGEEIKNGTIHVGEIIGKTLDGKDIYKFTELGMAENVKIREPQYKDGDFVINMKDSVLIFKKKVGDFIYGHAHLADGRFVIAIIPSSTPIERFATEEEKQKMLNALAKRGKRWNEEKKCIEDIPKRKFQKGDKVRIKVGVSSKTHWSISPIFVTSMDKLIGKELTVEDYGNLFVKCDGYYFSEEWIEPVEELKKGDLAIFWDNGAQHRASVRMYGSLFTHDYLDTGGIRWDNAIKFESKEQYEKLIKGEL